ncbi:MAG TPA: hypothetical protein VHL54_07475, partial [Actinomycetota bacterium]|nr:hypothetical protein [Actinomycetota bacterium]
MGHEIWRLMQPHGDAASVKLPKGLVKRVFVFARPYRARIVVLMAIILGTSGLAVLNPLLIKLVIDEALPNRDLQLLTPITYAMEPFDALLLAGGVMGATSFGGSISAI